MMASHRHAPGLTPETDDPEVAAARLEAQLGSRALAEARYRLSLAEARFHASLARTGKDLSAVDHWAAVSRRLIDRQPTDQPGDEREASPR